MATTKYPLALLAGLSLVGALAGCSGAADAVGGGSSTDPTASAYVDGTYSATADYQSPNGTETIDVTLTLKHEIITDVQVVGHGTSPDSKLHQGQFSNGIAAVVVGKDIDDIQVDKVGGSSLTSGGFNEAVEEIKADAAS